MKSDMFQHELTNTSAVFGRKHDVKVVFQGDQAATSGELIILPTLADGEVSDTSKSVMRGYVDHEAGHVRHSDMEALKKHKQECIAAGNRLAPSLANALEDVWLERRVRNEYPGAESNLRAVTTAVNGEFIRSVGEMVEADRTNLLTDPKMIVPVALTWEGRKGYGGDTCGQCLDMLPENIRRALPKWIGALDGANNSRDVIAIANMIDKQIRDGSWDETEEEREAPSGDPGDEPTDGFEPGDGDGEGGGDGTGSFDDPVDSEGEPTDGGSDEYVERDEPYECEDGSEDGVDKGDLGGGAKGSTGSSRDYLSADEFVRPEEADDFNPYDKFDVEHAVNKVLASDGLLGEGYERYRPASTAHDKWHHRTDSPRKYGRYTLANTMRDYTAADYERNMAATAATVNVMRRKLERALMAREMRDWDFGRQEGRLDNRRLVQAMRGNPNVFKLRGDRAEMDTALTMLIDLSGSMSGNKARLASQCAIAMSEALDRTSVKYEVLGFNSSSGYANGVPRPICRGSRWEPIDMYIFKAFHERLFEAKGSLASILAFAGGNNVDGEALQYAWSRLSDRTERRKVMVVLSDGSPAANCDYGSSHLQTHLRSVIAALKDAKCEVIGIGILDDSVKAFYDKHVVVSSLEDLAGSAMDQIARVLLGDRFVVDNSKLLEVDKEMKRASIR